MKTTITLVLVGIGAALSLAFAPTVEGNVVLEHDPDVRADCVGQLLALDGEPTTFGTIVGTLNYTDDQYGGPCAALEHRLEHGWY